MMPIYIEHMTFINRLLYLFIGFMMLGNLAGQTWIYSFHFYGIDQIDVATVVCHTHRDTVYEKFCFHLIFELLAGFWGWVLLVL